MFSCRSTIAHSCGLSLMYPNLLSGQLPRSFFLQPCQEIEITESHAPSTTHWKSRRQISILVSFSSASSTSNERSRRYHLRVWTQV